MSIPDTSILDASHLAKSRQVRRAELRRQAFADFRQVYPKAPRDLVRVTAFASAAQGWKRERGGESRV